MHDNPKKRRRISVLDGQQAPESYLPRLEEMGEEAFVKRTDELWKAMQNGNVSTSFSAILLLRFDCFSCD